jgi:hypothetical protein
MRASQPSCRFPEQGVGGLAMGAGAVPMGADPFDLGFQQGNARVKFALRIGFEAFPGKRLCGVGPRARPVVVIHASCNILPGALAVKRRKS